MSVEINSFLAHCLNENKIKISEVLQTQFLHYLTLIQEWNRVYNLTAITDMKEMIMLHLIDSLSINPFLSGQSIIDVGSGAGLPGIPLALLNPTKKFVLIDSNNKKIQFLNHVIYTLQLKNLAAIHTRCEDFHPLVGFDCILSRAFSSIKTMLMGTHHFCAVEGQFLAMKGANPTDELVDLPQEFQLIAVHPLTIHGLDAKRHLVCLERK